MGRRRLRKLGFLLVAFLSSSCGGGQGSSNPPPPGDFQLAFATNPVVLQKGGATGDQINLTALNGFNGNVALSLSALSSGISVSPFFPTTISSTQGLGVSFTASSSAAIGSSIITLTGTSGNISHSIPLTIQIIAPPSFQLSLNPSSVTLNPNSSANVQVTLSGTIPSGSDVPVTVPFQISNLPGVTTSGPFNVSTAQPTATFQVIAALNAPSASNVPVQISGTFGSTVVNVNLLVSVNNTFPSSGPPSRSTFRRTDMEPTSAVYDSIRKQVFVGVPQLNEILVYSSVDAHKIAVIPVPVPNGLDISADGTKLIVASRTETFCVVDPAALQSESCNPVVFPGTSAFAAPETIYPMTLANGNILFVIGDQGTGGVPGGLVESDAATGVFTDVTPSGLGDVVAFARSADHSTVAIAGQSEIALFSSASDSFVTTVSFPVGFGSLAVNPNGTRIAALSAGPQSSTVVTLFDSQFNSLATYSLNSSVLPTRLLFSSDGSEIYVLTQGDLIVCLNSQTLAPIGLVPAQGSLGFPSDTDETGMIFAPEGLMRGIGFFDASAPRALGTDAPTNVTLSPPQGNPTNPQMTTVTAVSGLTTGSGFYFDSPPGSPQATLASILSIAPPTTARVDPPTHSAGTVNVTITNPDGQLSVLPDAFSYGPTIIAMTPNGGPSSGQTNVTLWGFGMDFPQNQIQVTVGGQAATVTLVSAGIQYLPFPSSLDSIQFTVPAGIPGLADVNVITPDGPTIAARSFQYLKSVQSFPIAGGLGQLVYDKPRQRLYATNYGTNQVDVFDLQSQSYIASIDVGRSPAGLALTPDGSRLVVANNGDGTASIIDPGTLKVTATLPVPLPPNPACGSAQPLWVATTSTNLAIISVGCSNVTVGIFEVLNLSTQTFGCGSSSTCSQFVSQFGGQVLNISSSADGTKIFATDNSTVITGELPIALWNVANDTLTVKNLSSFSEVAADADGTLFLADGAVFAPDVFFRYYLQELDYIQAAANSATVVPGEKLQSSGSLAYQPHDSVIDILDVHHGGLLWRIALPFQMQNVLDEIALDETGSRIFCISTNGISIVQLGVVPLSIGTVSPSSATTAGGTAVVIRGSGFQPGLSLQLGTQSIPARIVDSDTIDFTLPPLPAGPARLTLTNPDGTTYSLDDAILIQ